MPLTASVFSARLAPASWRVPLLVMGMLLAQPRAYAADESAALQALQTENARLKAQLEQLQHACVLPTSPAKAPPETANGAASHPSSPAAIDTPSSANADRSTMINTSTGNTSTIGTPAGNAPTSVDHTPPTTSIAPTPPPGYKLVPLAPPHSESGCRAGAFEQTADAPWKHEDNWSALHKGDTMHDVEALLGSDHFDITGTVNDATRTAWQFGKCGNLVQGYVVFQDGQALFWKTPDF